LKTSQETWCEKMADENGGNASNDEITGMQYCD